MVFSFFYFPPNKIFLALISAENKLFNVAIFSHLHLSGPSVHVLMEYGDYYQEWEFIFSKH